MSTIPLKRVNVATPVPWGGSLLTTLTVDFKLNAMTGSLELDSTARVIMAETRGKKFLIPLENVAFMEPMSKEDTAAIQAKMAAFHAAKEEKLAPPPAKDDTFRPTKAEAAAVMARR